MLSIVWSTPSKSFGCPEHHGPSNTAPMAQCQPCSGVDPGTCSIPMVTIYSSFEPYFATTCSNIGWTSFIVPGLKILQRFIHKIIRKFYSNKCLFVCLSIIEFFSVRQLWKFFHFCQMYKGFTNVKIYVGRKVFFSKGKISLQDY